MVTPTVSLSVVMITLNEERMLPGALACVLPWVEEVIIVDSGSRDRTIDVALEAGVRVIQRRFRSYGDQWNFAMTQVPLSGKWTLKLDPDERLSSGLIAEIRETLSAEPPFSGFTIPRRVWFLGRPLHVFEHVTRLWRTGTCRFSIAMVHERPIIEGTLGHLCQTMEHHECMNLHHWYEKQNRYSTLEAIMKVRGDSLVFRPRLLGSAIERRMFFKRSFDYLPFGYALLWIYLVFRYRLWRDGRVGFAWARARVEIQRMRALKIIDMRNRLTIDELPLPAVGEFDPRVEHAD